MTVLAWASVVVFLAAYTLIAAEKFTVSPPRSGRRGSCC
jgi:hypothetical protein